MAAEFRYHGNIDSLGRSAEAFPAATRVSKNAQGEWAKTASGQVGSGWAYATVLAIGSRYNKNIFDSTYGEGVLGNYNAERNYNKGYTQAIGEPVGVVYGPDVVIANFTLYHGLPAINDLLAVGADGKLMKTTDRAIAVAEVQIGAINSGDPIKIKALK